MDNYILRYYQQIRDGSVTVNKWIRMVYEYIVKGLEGGVFFFDQKKADRVIRFKEAHVYHTEGKLAPGRFKMELWQKAMDSCIYGIVDDEGLRVFREIFVVTARKQGKTKMATSWAEQAIYNEGEYGARVFCVAPKLEQADLVYGDFWQSVSLDKELSAITKHRKSDMYVAESNSTVKKIAFNARKSDGFNPSLCICDEIASWPPEQGLKQYEVMKSAMGAREQPLMISISTAGYVSDGIYDELMKRSTSFLLGTSKEKRLLPFIYQIDEVEKWNDINELRKSNPNLGVSVSVDYLIEEIAIAEGSLSKKSEFLCKYCNIKQNSSQAWLDARAIEKSIGAPLRLEDFSGCYAVIGIDLSKTTDLSACVLLIERDGIINTFARFYLPKEKIDEASARDNLPYRAYIQRGLLFESGENFIDYQDIYNWVVELVSKYHIYPLKVGYDRYSATYLVQALDAAGIQTDDVYQGTNLTPVIRITEGLMKDGKINIGDNDLLKIHFLNSALKTETETERVRLIKIEQRAHIDGMAAFLDAMTMRDKYWKEIGSQLINERRQ